MSRSPLGPLSITHLYRYSTRPLPLSSLTLFIPCLSLLTSSNWSMERQKSSRPTKTPTTNVATICCICTNRLKVTRRLLGTRWHTWVTKKNHRQERVSWCTNIGRVVGNYFQKWIKDEANFYNLEFRLATFPRNHFAAHPRSSGCNIYLILFFFGQNSCVRYFSHISEKLSNHSVLSSINPLGIKPRRPWLGQRESAEFTKGGTRQQIVATCNDRRTSIILVISSNYAMMICYWLLSHCITTLYKRDELYPVSYSIMMITVSKNRIRTTIFSWAAPRPKLSSCSGGQQFSTKEWIEESQKGRPNS